MWVNPDPPFGGPDVLTYLLILTCRVEEILEDVSKLETTLIYTDPPFGGLDTLTYVLICAGKVMVTACGHLTIFITCSSITYLHIQTFVTPCRCKLKDMLKHLTCGQRRGARERAG